MTYTHIDWLVILIAAVLNMFIGFVWYSKWLFGPIWMKLANCKEQDMRRDFSALAAGFALSLIIAFFLFIFQSAMQVTTVTDGMIVGFLFWLGFVATTQISSFVWCKKPIQLFFVDTGYKLLSFLVMSGLMGA